MYFVTGSTDKFKEAQSVLPDLEQLSLDLPEIQEINPEIIIKAKLEEAAKQQPGSLVVEDTSLYFEALHGLPGPLIKWFLKSLGNDGLYQLTDSLGDTKATAKTVIGLHNGAGESGFFEGSIEGTIVAPRGTNGFGWDLIFQPDGYTKTFAEMTAEEKNQISMRKKAFESLRKYLDTQL